MGFVHTAVFANSVMTIVSVVYAMPCVGGACREARPDSEETKYTANKLIFPYAIGISQMFVNTRRDRRQKKNDVEDVYFGG